jgi:orotidine-5'-phosphate decarboxylase
LAKLGKTLSPPPTGLPKAGLRPMLFSLKNSGAMTINLLSGKPIPVRERLIFAMDVPTHVEARECVKRLGDSVQFYKLGLQIFMADGYYDLVEWLRDQGKKIFVDLKFFDVPETVRLAVAQLKNRGVSFATVHGNDGMLRAAAAEKNEVKILAVTVLTSLDESDMRDLGFACDIKALVLSRAKRALEIGCDGVISSGLEAEELRKHYGDKFLIVSPGIRPVENRPVDDQKRIVTVKEAFLKGADYIVVGRPIKNAPDPRVKAEEIQQDIAELFGARANP